MTSSLIDTKLDTLLRNKIWLQLQIKLSIDIEVNERSNLSYNPSIYMYRMSWKEKNYILKIMLSDNIDGLPDDNISRELSITKLIVNNNQEIVVKPIKSWIGLGYAVIILPYYGNNLRAVPYSNFNHSRLCTLILNIVKNLQVLKENRILHLNIRVENIMMDSQDNVYLTDFKSAIFTDINYGYIPYQAYNPEYRAPEIWMLDDNFDNYGYHSEVWALGVLIYYLLKGKYPFGLRSDKSNYLNLKKIYQHMSCTSSDYPILLEKYPKLHRVKTNLSNCLDDLPARWTILLTQIFQLNPTKRTSLDNIAKSVQRILNI